MTTIPLMLEESQKAKSELGDYTEFYTHLAMQRSEERRVGVARNQLGGFDRQSGSNVVLANGVDEVLLIELRQNLLPQSVGHLVERQSGVALNCERIDVHKPA